MAEIAKENGIEHLVYSSVANSLASVCHNSAMNTLPCIVLIGSRYESIGSEEILPARQNTI
jgi:hypothetical protein